MPHLTLDDLKTRISDATRRLNPGVFGPGAVDRLAAEKHGQSSGTLDRRQKAKRGRKDSPHTGDRFCITLTAHLANRMDDDNLAHACKPLRDAIADNLGIDDGDPRLRWEYGQLETRGKRGVTVKIERMN